VPISFGPLIELNGKALRGVDPPSSTIDVTPTLENAPEASTVFGVRPSKFTRVPKVGESPAPKSFGVPVVNAAALQRQEKRVDALHKSKNVFIVEVAPA
jgi:hypothetical protein